jgi:uncharacterized protein (DUF433 family)
MPPKQFEEYVETISDDDSRPEEAWEVKVWQPEETMKKRFLAESRQLLLGNENPLNKYITIYEPESESIRLALQDAQSNDVNALVNIRMRALADKLCEEHLSISTHEGIFGGLPHIKDVRLSVADILSHLYVLGSIAAILERYGSDVTEEQIKEAIAYAQDFLEEALHTRS